MGNRQSTIRGAVILDGRGDVLRAIGGSISVFPTPARAAEVAAAYAGYPSMTPLAPFRTAPCTVTIRPPAGPEASRG